MNVIIQPTQPDLLFLNGFIFDVATIVRVNQLIINKTVLRKTKIYIIQPTNIDKTILVGYGISFLPFNCNSNLILNFDVGTVIPSIELQADSSELVFGFLNLSDFD